MRRFVGLVVLLFCTIPVGLSIAGCSKAVAVQYCNAGESGPQVGQVASITLSPALATYGESLSYGQIGNALSASGIDCKGNSVSVRAFTYATSDMSFADINPSTGQVCGGTWNRNSGGGIPDYTTCNPPATTPANFLAYVTATANGAVSNAIPVYIHPTVTSIGTGSPSASCLVGTEAVTGSSVAGSPTVAVSSTAGIAAGLGISGLGIPANSLITAVNNATVTFSNNATITTIMSAGSTVLASPVVTVASTTGFVAGEGISGSGIPANTLISAVNTAANTLTISNNATVTAMNVALTTNLPLTIIGNPTSNCCPADAPLVAGVATYNGTSCVSQGLTAQLVASVYQNGTALPADNITCKIGRLTFQAQSAPSVVTIDQNGVATANQPGSTTITASVANSSTASSAGFFSTCPPASIVLSVPGKPAGTSNISVSQNNTQPLVATVLDMNGVTLTGLSLEFNSTTPQTIPASSSTITPIFPGAATITAVCQPDTCNPAPTSEIGYLGNGKPLTSNGITVTTPGTSSSVIYIGSTASQYVFPMDFTTNQSGSLIKLPYVPNSMVITQDSSSIYLGSSQGLMQIVTANNSQGAVNANVMGTVLSVSPDGSTLVITDTVRKQIELYATANSSISTLYGGVGTHAQWSPDSQTVYITTTTNTLLTHSAFSGWQPAIADEIYSDVAVTVPSVGAYFAGSPSTEGRSYCPSTTVSGTGNPPTVTNVFSPLADTETAITDRLTATNDGAHILGAHATGAAGTSTVTDLVVTLPTATACPTVVPTTYFKSVVKQPVPLAGVTATAIDGVVAASNSALAFVTYTGTGGVLPVYLPATAVLTNVALSNGATAPLAGVFSTDNLTFFADTAGDNAVHLISINGTTAAESGTIIKPLLQDVNGSITAPNLIVQRPKKPTS